MTRRRLWLPEIIDVILDKFDDLVDALGVVIDVNHLYPEGAGFGSSVQNVSSTLVGSDSGFVGTDAQLLGVNAISAGLTAGFAPRDDDAASAPLFDTMDQYDLDSGIGNAMEGLKALYENANLLGDADKLAEGLTAATSVFATDSIKMVAKRNKARRGRRRLAGATVIIFTAPMGGIGFGSTNAVAGFDKMALPKQKMAALLKANAQAILDAVLAGKDADDAALNTTAYAIEVADGMSTSSDTVYLGRDDLVIITDAMSPALDGAFISPIPDVFLFLFPFPSPFLHFLFSFTQLVIFFSFSSSRYSCPELEGIFEAISAVPTGTLTKNEMMALCGEIVGKMVTQAGRARSVDATNIASAIEELARVGIEKSAYITTNRADFTASDLPDLARFAAKKIMRSIMEMKDTTKVPPNKMAVLIAAASKGGAKVSFFLWIVIFFSILLTI